MRETALAQPRARWPGSGRRSPPPSPRTRSTRSARSSLRWIAELSAERGLPIQIHLSETEEEVDDCIAAHGLRPAAYLDQLGMLSERTVLAHGVWLDHGELELIAARGCTVVTNPAANMKLAVGGVFPYPAARAAGVAVGLGTDGAGSNDSLDLLADLKLFALAQKHAAADPTAIAAAEAWAVATGARAPLLGAGGAARGRRRRRLPPAAPRSPELGDRRAHLQPRLRRRRRGRRHHRRRRPGADARRRAARAGGDRRPGRRARPIASASDLYPPGVFATSPAMVGYQADKDKLLKRLSRVEGQVRGVSRMVEEERYCIDVLTQIGAIQAALDKVALGLIDEHTRHCVVEAEGGERAEKVDELMAALGRFVGR